MYNNLNAKFQTALGGPNSRQIKIAKLLKIYVIFFRFLQRIRLGSRNSENWDLCITWNLVLVFWDFKKLCLS